MATRIIEETDCDICDSKIIPVKTIRLATGKARDPAGGPSETTGIEFDMCMKCLAKHLVILVNDLGKQDKVKTEWKIRNTRSW